VYPQVYPPLTSLKPRESSLHTSIDVAAHFARYRGWRRTRRRGGMTHLFRLRYHPFVPSRCHPSLLVFTVSARPHLLSLSLLVVAPLSCWLSFLSPSPSSFLLVLIWPALVRSCCTRSRSRRCLCLLSPLALAGYRSCRLTLTCTRSCWS